MNFTRYFTQRLVEHGMLDDMAAEVMERVKQDAEFTEMSGRWNDSAETYPQMLLVSVWYSIKRVALAYIDEKCPHAFFRSEFLDDAG